MSLKRALATMKAGIFFGFPNVCFKRVPPPVNQVPLPLPNVAELAAAKGAVDKVLIENKKVLAQGAEIPSSKGDEVGDGGGVQSGTHGKDCVPWQFSEKVHLAGKKAVLHLGMARMNGKPANLPVGLQAQASQDKVSGGA